MGQRLRYSPLTDPNGPPQGLVRFGFEAAILLGIAVTLFRAFFAEGYMISTGSMAPSLLGFHRHVCCPGCRFEFDRGAAGEEDASAGSADAAARTVAADEWAIATTRCPLCGTTVPDAAAPRTEGDQLMVHKHHFDWRDPRRWEVVVFRNPQNLSQAYVKRVVGLPGETIELIDGDVYADGVLQRKPIAVQKSLRIPVDDFQHQPPEDDPDWRSRWRTASDHSTWRSDGAVLRFRESSDSGEAGLGNGLDWVEYQHWIRAGGRHRCRVPLAHWPDRMAEPGLIHDGFRYDAAAGELESVGAIPHRSLVRWLERLSDPAAQEQLQRLYELSHQPPLRDQCAYNHPDAAIAQSAIHDLMVEMTLQLQRAGGWFVLAMHDGCHELQCRFDLADGTATLTADGKDKVHRLGRLPQSLLSGQPVEVIMSQFDRQVIVTVDGEELFPALLYSGEGTRPALPECPVRFGAAAADLTLSGLRLDRDVYYTNVDAASERREFVLGDGELFVLGDNSPVSLDSRAWPSPSMPRELLIGKPFVVHLPSRTETLHWQGREAHLRVPDFSRVRYIR